MDMDIGHNIMCTFHKFNLFIFLLKADQNSVYSASAASMQAGLPYSHPPHPHSSINQTAAAAAAMNPYAASSSLLASQVKKNNLVVNKCDYDMMK